MYRDIKPANILINENTYKLADFGFCQKLDENGKANGFCGTPDYIAPEIAINRDEYDDKCYIWSLVVLYQMYYNSYPIRYGESLDEYIENLKHLIYLF